MTLGAVGCIRKDDKKESVTTKDMKRRTSKKIKHLIPVAMLTVSMFVMI